MRQPHVETLTMKIWHTLLGAIAIGTAGACQHPMRRELFEAVLRDGSSRLALPEKARSVY